MQQPIRSTRWRTPEKGETLIRSREEACKLITALEKKLAGKLSKVEKAHSLCARAGLYAAIGDSRMLEAAQDAWKFDHNANTAGLMAMSYHHHGRLHEANELYKKSYHYPHEPGWEIDLSYAQSLMSQGRWLEAWPIVKTLKKRMVFAGYLSSWDGKATEEVSVISEGGYGDIIHLSRYLPLIADRCKKVTVYLPPFFFEGGFVDLARNQPWYPEIKLLTETPQHVPAIGFFDMPAVFETTPETVPPSPVWLSVRKADLPRNKPLVGLCWSARAMEVPICPDGVYRSMTEGQMFELFVGTFNRVQHVSLQLNSKFKHACLIAPEIKNWTDTAALISSLDAVISVDTSVMHLAASMGKPVYVPLSGATDWKFLLSDEQGCPWYPSLRTFRNDGFGFDRAVSKIIDAVNRDYNVASNLGSSQTSM